MVRPRGAYPRHGDGCDVVLQGNCYHRADNDALPSRNIKCAPPPSSPPTTTTTAAAPTTATTTAVPHSAASVIVPDCGSGARRGVLVVSMVVWATGGGTVQARFLDCFGHFWGCRSQNSSSLRRLPLQIEHLLANTQWERTLVARYTPGDVTATSNSGHVTAPNVDNLRSPAPAPAGTAVPAHDADEAVLTAETPAPASAPAFAPGTATDTTPAGVSDEAAAAEEYAAYLENQRFFGYKD